MNPWNNHQCDKKSWVISHVIRLYKQPLLSTCWCASGAGWPDSSHGWSPAELWPGTWGRRWTEVWLAGCSRALPGASPGLSRRDKRVWRWKRRLKKRKEREVGRGVERRKEMCAKNTLSYWGYLPTAWYNNDALIKLSKDPKHFIKVRTG